MKQNNISTQKGRRVFSRKMLFFLFLILAVIALFLGLNLKRYTDRERKQGNIEKEITTEKEKTSVRKLHKKYKDMIGWLEIKGTGFSYPVMQTGMKGHHRMTGSIISTGMCMVGTVFMGRRFWMSDAGKTVTTALFTVTTSMAGDTLAICRTSGRKHFL